MWLRASYTVENSVIIPMFTIIVITIMTVCFNIHDEIMVENIQSQVAVQSELENMDSGKKYMLEERAKKYLGVRTILSDKDDIDIGASSIKVSEPEKTIRIMRAFIEAIN